MSIDHPYLEVAFPIPARQTFTYSIPGALRGRVQPGCRIYAPFGKRNALGFVAELIEQPSIPLKGIKPISRLIDEEPLFLSLIHI